MPSQLVTLLNEAEYCLTNWFNIAHVKHYVLLFMI